MIKTSLAVAALVTVAGLGAMPALADSLSDFDEYHLLNRLEDRGIEATEVALWGTKLRVTVVAVDGSPTFIFLDPDTLRPADGTTGTRVLSSVDVGVER